MTTKDWIKQSIQVKQSLLDDKTIDHLNDLFNLVVEALQNGNKVFFCGNGGSAADAQHLAAELSVRYKTNRRALPGIALGTNFSHLTAAANDFGYDEVFSRQLQAEGSQGDVLIALSTSGNSENVLKAIGVGNKIGIITMGWTGSSGGKMASICKHIFKVPSNEVPRIQECHMLVGHILCEHVDQAFSS